MEVDNNGQHSKDACVLAKWSGSEEGGSIVCHLIHSLNLSLVPLESHK